MLSISAIEIGVNLFMLMSLTFMYRALNIPGKLGQNNACWCPGSWRHQVISWYKKGHVGLVTVTGTIKVVLYPLTHRGRVTHICISKLASIGSDNGLSPGWRQAIIWTNVGILLIGPLGTNFSEILIEIHTFSFRKMHLKMSSGKWRPENGGHLVSASMC